MSDYNPERGQVTAHIGKINAPGSWGVEKDENYFEWFEMEVAVDENKQEVILCLGENISDGGITLDLLTAKALKALLDLSIDHLSGIKL